MLAGCGVGDSPVVVGHSLLQNENWLSLLEPSRPPLPNIYTKHPKLDRDY